MLAVCIDGPNGAGKSSLAEEIAARLRASGLQAAVLTDTAVKEAAGRAEGDCPARFPEIRAALRKELIRSRPGIFLQERGLVSHLVFEHLAAGREAILPFGLCCAPDQEAFFLTAILMANPVILNQRLQSRPQFAPALPLELQASLFEAAAVWADWPVYRNDDPADLNSIAGTLVSAIMERRAGAKRSR